MSKADLIEYTLLMAFVALASAGLFHQLRRQRQRDLEHFELAVEHRGQHCRQLKLVGQARGLLAALRPSTRALPLRLREGEPGRDLRPAAYSRPPPVAP